MKSNSFLYFIKEGVTSVFSHGFMSVATIAIMMACLFMMGGFTLLSANIQEMIASLESQNQVVAFVDDSLTDEEARSLSAKIEAIENVNTVEFVSREQAMNKFLKKYQDNTLFSDIDATVFRHRYVITMDDIEGMEKLQTDLYRVPGIATVNAHLEISRGFVTMRNIVTVVSVVLTAVLLIISIFIMANTIKLTSFSRREEIGVMKMVGATNSFIRWPFVIEGLFLGIIGSALAYLLTWGVYEILYTRANGTVTFAFVNLVPFSKYAVPLLIGYGAVGILVGVISSSTAIKNYLKI
jgi:cell division transport system permease protein